MTPRLFCSYFRFLSLPRTSPFPRQHTRLPYFAYFTRVQTTMADIEVSKRAAAKAAVENHYPKNARWVGIGSGTTIVYVVEAIKALGLDTAATRYVPTGYQSRQLIISAGLTAVEFDAIPPGTILDVAFDGADEVDEDLNCVKGGGACLFREKIVVMQAKEFICVAGKLTKRLSVQRWDRGHCLFETLACWNILLIIHLFAFYPHRLA